MSPVICIETGKRYESSLQALNELGGRNGYWRIIENCCKGEASTAFGYHWKYAEYEKKK